MHNKRTDSQRMGGENEPKGLLSSSSMAVFPTQSLGTRSARLPSLSKHQRVSHPWHSPATSCPQRMWVESLHGIPRAEEREGGVRRKTVRGHFLRDQGEDKTPPVPTSGMRHVPVISPCRPHPKSWPGAALPEVPTHLRLLGMSYQPNNHTPSWGQQLVSGPRHSKCLCAGEA